MKYKSRKKLKDHCLSAGKEYRVILALVLRSRLIIETVVVVVVVLMRLLFLSHQWCII